LLRKLKAWLSLSNPCRYCDGSGYESNTQVLWNNVRLRGPVVLAVVLLMIKFSSPPARGPIVPPPVRPAALAPR
jgi:hypothetical protein